MECLSTSIGVQCGKAKSRLEQFLYGGVFAFSRFLEWPASTSNESALNLTVPPPHSPYLASCDIFSNNEIRADRTIEEIQMESRYVLNVLTSADFQDCFQSWQGRWNRCINIKDNYPEGDNKS